jgi:hypothetical protein
MNTCGSKLSLKHAAGAEVARGGIAKSDLSLRGHLTVEHWRDGKLLAVYDFNNGITNEGKNKLLDVMFHGVSAIGTWYLGLIDNAGYSALAAGDTYDNINQAGNGWDEFADYTDANNGNSASTRPEWQENAASSQSITNTTVSIFNITASGTVKGVFACGGTNAQTKSDHTASGNYLWATALFNSGDVPVNNGDQLKVTYSVSA